MPRDEQKLTGHMTGSARDKKRRSRDQQYSEGFSHCFHDLLYKYCRQPAASQANPAGRHAAVI
jgi:hypothetical protein